MSDLANVVMAVCAVLTLVLTVRQSKNSKK